MGLLAAILGGMTVGYMVGVYLLDRWINQNHEDIDNEREPKD